MRQEVFVTVQGSGLQNTYIVIGAQKNCGGEDDRTKERETKITLAS